MKLGTEVGLGPGHIVLDGDPAPPPQRSTAPNFRRLSIVAKRSPISATAEQLSEFVIIQLFMALLGFSIVLQRLAGNTIVV